MRKLLVTLALAGTLCVPSVVFAEANWYGSLRAGITSSDGNINVVDGVSRWGVKGSTEAGEGLTAVYRFEHKLDTSMASLSGGGRLSYVGLSGGFGTVTAGQIWSASFNSFGAFADNSVVHGNAETTYRHGNAVSYAYSNDLMAFQADVVYGSPDPVAPEVAADGNTAIPANVAANRYRNRENLQKTEFGLTVNVGEMGKVAIAHIDNKHLLNDTSNVMVDIDGTSTLVKAVPQLKAADGTTDIVDDKTSWRSKSTFVGGQISVANLTVYLGSGKTSYTNTTAAPATAVSAGTAGDGSLAVKPDDKTTFFGFRGGLGDTGVNYLFQWRDIKNSHKPWLLGLYKSLGGGASINLEHVNNDGDSSNLTHVNLKVDF